MNKWPLFMRSRWGFTLFELIVAIAIVALLMSLVISGTDRYLETDMKKASNHLGSEIRYLYNKSVTEGTYLRLVIDLTERSYWVEATKDPVLLTSEEGADKKKKGEEGKEKTKNEETAETEKTSEAEGETKASGQVPKLEMKKPQFSQVESYLLKPTKLPDPVFFKDVMTEHQPTPVEGGQVTINFFPNGYVEHAIINLRDEDDEVHYSIETNPITGRVKITNEYKTFEKK
jgi:prepilin-type N-terminal cleavage/methylation domain-containing protein